MVEQGIQTNFTIDRGQIVLEANETGITKYREIYGYGRIGKEARNEDLFMYHTNNHGDITSISNELGRVTNSYTYDAFGDIKDKLEKITNRYQYSGEQKDELTGQYYLRARYYNPTIGRFTQEDTFRGDGLNLYSYVHNNPVKYVDPSGNFSILTAAIGAGIGAVINTAIEVGSQIKSGKSIGELDLKRVGVKALSGAASGALMGSGVGLIGAVVGNAAISTADSLVTDIVLDKKTDALEIGVNAFVSGVTGTVAGLIGGPGVQNTSAYSGKMITNVLTKSYEVVQPSRYFMKQIANKELLKGAVKTVGTNLGSQFANEIITDSILSNMETSKCGGY